MKRYVVEWEHPIDGPKKSAPVSRKRAEELARRVGLGAVVKELS